MPGRGAKSIKYEQYTGYPNTELRLVFFSFICVCVFCHLPPFLRFSLLFLCSYARALMETCQKGCASFLEGEREGEKDKVVSLCLPSKKEENTTHSRL